MSAALAMIVNTESRILFVRRVGQLQPGTRAAGRPGQFCLPGGRIKAGETPEQAVVREVLEETELTVEPVRRLAEFSDQTYLLCRLIGSDQIRLNLRELSDSVWVSACHVLQIGFVADLKRLKVVFQEAGFSIPEPDAGTLQSDSI